VIISLVVAASENNIIGKNNQLLWHLPNDMKFFKNITWGMPVVMGRKTFESMGKPLTGRTNIVVTRNDDFKADGVITANSLDEAMKAAAETDAKEAYVIGGGEIYKQSLPIATKIFLTRVHATLDGDARFPEFNASEWTLVSVLDFNADEKHAYAYSFEVWERK
jgi:dihydrofolate reductase